MENEMLNERALEAALKAMNEKERKMLFAALIAAATTEEEMKGAA